MTVFDKPAFSPAEQVDKLRARGLRIDDESRVLHHLANVSYYRLSAYTRPFYIPDDAEHCFQSGVAFEDIFSLYVFDRELRLLLLDAIERLVVALRAQITNTLAEHHGPHGYLEPSVFDTRYRHDWLLNKLDQAVKEREVETFLAHYRAKYVGAPPQPPSGWP